MTAPADDRAPLADPQTLAPTLPAPADPGVRDRVERMLRTARLLDSQLRVPGTELTFGVDALLGLIPGVGGAAGMALSITVILQAIMAGATPATVARMVGIAGLDGVVSSVPVVGGLSDFVIKANNRNARIAAAQLADPAATTQDSRRSLRAALLVLVLGAAAVFLLLLVGVVLLLRWIF